MAVPADSLCVLGNVAVGTGPCAVGLWAVEDGALSLLSLGGVPGARLRHWPGRVLAVGARPGGQGWLLALEEGMVALAPEANVESAATPSGRDAAVYARGSNATPASPGPGTGLSRGPEAVTAISEVIQDACQGHVAASQLLQRASRLGYAAVWALVCRSLLPLHGGTLQGMDAGNGCSWAPPWWGHSRRTSHPQCSMAKRLEVCCPPSPNHPSSQRMQVIGGHGQRRGGLLPAHCRCAAALLAGPLDARRWCVFGGKLSSAARLAAIDDQAGGGPASSTPAAELDGREPECRARAQAPPSALFHIRSGPHSASQGCRAWSLPASPRGLGDAGSDAPNRRQVCARGLGIVDLAWARGLGVQRGAGFWGCPGSAVWPRPARALGFPGPLLPFPRARRKLLEDGQRITCVLTLAEAEIGAQEHSDRALDGRRAAEGLATAVLRAGQQCISERGTSALQERDPRQVFFACPTQTTPAFLRVAAELMAEWSSSMDGLELLACLDQLATAVQVGAGVNGRAAAASGNDVRDDALLAPVCRHAVRVQPASSLPLLQPGRNRNTELPCVLGVNPIRRPAQVPGF